jgi:S-adenosylmethionine uptake transporter
VLFLRGVLTSVFLFGLAAYLGQLRRTLPRQDWWLIAIRSVAEVGAAWFFLSALFNMPLANVSAILQSLPLTVTLAGALFLRENVGWRRFLAILIGFVGVLMIVQPGGDGFTLHSVYALASVACVTVRDLAARRMSAASPTVFVSLIAAFSVTTFAGAGAIFVEWQPLGVESMLLILASAAFVIFGYIFSVSAMRIGEIGFVTPFRYTSLLVALVLGALVFGTFPDTLTLAGAAIVVATGLFTLLRELRLRQTGPSVTPPTRL